MTEVMGLATVAPPLVSGLALLGLLLFALAAWRGRWSLWVGGYLLVIAAVVAAFAVRRPERAEEPDGARSATTGIVQYAGERSMARERGPS